MRYAVECNKQEFLTVANYYKWDNFIVDDLDKSKHVIYIREDRAYAWDALKDSDVNTISYNSWSLVKGVDKLVKPNASVELTDEYTADINYNTKVVKVGCQSIPFNKVTELYNLINQ